MNAHQRRLKRRKDLGLWIREQRELMGVDQETIAATLPSPRQATISDVENGRKNYGIDTYLDVLEALGEPLPAPREPVDK